MIEDASPAVHVVPEPDGDQWTVEVEGSGQAESAHPTQDDAIEAARGIARQRGAKLEVHGADGEVKERDSYEELQAPGEGGE